MKIFVFSLFVVLLVLAGCQSNVIDNSTIVEVGSVSFQDDVLPIFLSTCGGSGCHVNEAVNRVELTNYQATINSFAETYNTALVLPGNVAGSPLIDKILANPRFGVRMPDSAPPLTNAQIEIISTWVEDGALDN